MNLPVLEVTKQVLTNALMATKVPYALPVSKASLETLSSIALSVQIILLTYFLF